MAGQTRKSVKTDHSNASESQGNQLREIQNLLFGEQLGHVEEEIDTFRKEIDSRLGSLEKKIQSTIELQEAKFNKELSLHSEHLHNLQKTQQSDKANVDVALDNLKKLIQNHHSESNKANGNLHEELQRETDKIRAVIAQQQEALQGSIDQSVDLLTQNKTDRKELANLLQTVAQSLDASG